MKKEGIHGRKKSWDEGLIEKENLTLKEIRRGSRTRPQKKNRAPKQESDKKKTIKRGGGVVTKKNVE